VVIGSGGHGDAVEHCLAALDPQRDGAEVIVCEAEASPDPLRARFPWARFIECPGELVPELWSGGIERSEGDLVALTIAPMIPAADWLPQLRIQHARHGAFAGAIEPGRGLRLRDWAEYFCRYVRDMLPFAEHACVESPGDNCAYARPLLERTRELYADGFWEPVVNRRLAEEGVTPWHTPELVVRQGRSAGIAAFTRQRLVHGRAHGRQRGSRFGRTRNLAGVLGAPAVPALLTFRILREVFAKRRHRLVALASVPAIVLFNIAWALGEAAGHVDALRS
jgi:hypothetical protein